MRFVAAVRLALRPPSEDEMTRLTLPTNQFVPAALVYAFRSETEWLGRVRVGDRSTGLLGEPVEPGSFVGGAFRRMILSGGELFLGFV